MVNCSQDSDFVVVLLIGSMVIAVLIGFFLTVKGILNTPECTEIKITHDGLSLVDYTVIRHLLKNEKQREIYHLSELASQEHRWDAPVVFFVGSSFDSNREAYFVKDKPVGNCVTLHKFEI